ncbi:unnamed protein product [Protopolystoma xenopodis]|uniref:Uncharacterized protein n=1 Tax=Protopolystoma xenopodis TaxID=117903 RepID=A0A3S5AGH5_9PLAT|nr:unnamed protein product [Protopolystoma xenopodis]
MIACSKDVRSSGGTDLRISSRNTFTRTGRKLNNYETRDSSKANFSSNTMHLPCRSNRPVRKMYSTEAAIQATAMADTLDCGVVPVSCR